MGDELDGVSYSARKIIAPIDEQIRALKYQMDLIQATLAENKTVQAEILRHVSEIETDRKVVSAAAVGSIVISSVALMFSIIAIIAAFTIR